MNFYDLLYYVASLMILISGAALFAPRFASSRPVVCQALTRLRFFLPGAFAVLSVVLLLKSNTSGAAVLGLCAVGIALAQYLRRRSLDGARD